MHRHVWKVESQRVEESPFDQLARLGPTSLKNLPEGFFRRDVVVTYRCESCGEEKVARV